MRPIFSCCNLLKILNVFLVNFREQLKRCIEQINDLTSHQQSLESQISNMQEAGNTASTGLLTTQISKVELEIASEEQVKTNLKVIFEGIINIIMCAE